MKLTSHYRRTALFDSTIPYEQDRDPSSPKDRIFTFNIVPFQYMVVIEHDRPGYYEVSFRITDIIVDNDVLTKYLSDLWGRPVSSEQVWDLREMVQFRSHAILGVGNSTQVFATVIQIVKNFIRDENPQCIIFNAAETSRQKLYRSILRRMFPEYRVEEKEMGHAINFEVCRIEEKV